MFSVVTRCIACGLAALVLATTGAAAAPIDDDDPDPSPIAVLNAFADALSTRALDRAQALLADNATVADERGEYVGDSARDWLVRTSNDGIHVRLLRVSGIDTDERGTPGYTTWWVSFTVALSSETERNLGVPPHTREASAILQGSVVHSFRLEPLGTLSEPLVDARVSPGERPAEPGSPSLWPFVSMMVVVAVLGVLAYRRRGRRRSRLVTFSQLRMLSALHEATLHRRAARTYSPLE